jgi:ABC-type antimicrobial peptide transport system permease subunit
VRALVLGYAARLTGWRILLGLGASLIAGRALGFVLVGVSPYDPVVLCGTALMVATPAVGAAAGPALRASRVDPVRALRAG